MGPPATTNAVDVHAWWLVPGDPVEALDYVCTHLPAGTLSSATVEGGVGGSNTPENEIGAFDVPGNPGTLVIWAVRLPNGSTALRADAQVVWITPRAVSTTIPSGAHLLSISAHSESVRADGALIPESSVLSLLERLPSQVTSAARIEAVVALLNGLRVRQPGLTFCPADLGATGVELSLYASPGAAPLAVADIEPEGCARVSLAIDGAPQPALEGGWSLIGQIGEALGVSATSGPPVGAAPRISRLHMSSERFGVIPEDIVTPGIESGTRFLFDLSAAAEVSVAIGRLSRGSRYAGTCGAHAAKRRRRRPRTNRCGRAVVLDRFTRPTEREGEDAIAFSGKLGRRALAPGRYVAVLSARNTGGRSLASVEFEIAY
jgi:hypothetical protein